jgi:hypothetical protein
MAVGDKIFAQGLSNAVKSNDSLYPPDWRLSYGARPVSDQLTELQRLRDQLEAQQAKLCELEAKLAGN